MSQRDYNIIVTIELTVAMPILYQSYHRYVCYSTGIITSSVLFSYEYEKLRKYNHMAFRIVYNILLSPPIKVI